MSSVIRVKICDTAHMTGDSGSAHSGYMYVNVVQNGRHQEVPLKAGIAWHISCGHQSQVYTKTLLNAYFPVFPVKCKLLEN